MRVGDAAAAVAIQGEPPCRKDETTSAGRLTRRRRKERAARESLGMLGQTLATTSAAEYRLATINVTGLKGPGTRGLLVLFLVEFHVWMRVPMETRHEQPELKGIRGSSLDYGYKVVAERRQGTGGSWGKGRVLTLTRFRVSFLEFPRGPLPVAPIDACAIMIFLCEGAGDTIRVSGVSYPPPPGPKNSVNSSGAGCGFKPSRNLMKSLLGPQSFSGQRGGGKYFRRRVVRGLNPTARADGYECWPAENRDWEPTNPHWSTHGKEGSPDKIIRFPGSQVPACFLDHATCREAEEGRDY